MSPDGSETKFKKEMAKQPLTLMIRIESGAHFDIENTHCAIAKRIRLPIPPPIATKKYLLIQTRSYKFAPPAQEVWNNRNTTRTIRSDKSA